MTGQPHRFAAQRANVFMVFVNLSGSTGNAFASRALASEG
jgi:hypothetical protein